MAAESVESKENATVSRKALRALIEKGKKKGSLSYAEINEAISEDLQSSDQLDDILVIFKQLGVALIDKEKVNQGKAGNVQNVKKTTAKKNVVKQPASQNTSKKQSAANCEAQGNDTKEKSKREREKEFLANQSGSSDMEFGTVTDPVKMYLREMGMVTLLSREGEIEIAKKIEVGERDILRAMLACPITVATILTLGRRMEGLEGREVEARLRPKHILRDVDEGDVRILLRCPVGILHEVIRCREDDLGSLRDHIIYHLLQGSLRSVGGVQLVQIVEASIGEFLGDVLGGGVMGLAPAMVIVGAHQDNAEDELLRCFSGLLSGSLGRGRLWPASSQRQGHDDQDT